MCIRDSSESQERMAVVVANKDVEEFIALANEENLEATPVAVVAEKPRLVMRWNGRTICDISREFLNSNGAKKHATALVGEAKVSAPARPGEGFEEQFANLMSELNVCSRKGLAERFDATIGAGTVLMPFGGKTQATPIQTMVAKLPVLHGETKTCSGMAWGFNPFVSEQSPYHGAWLAAVSYTHLDVYKRQARKRPWRSWRRCCPRTPGSRPTASTRGGP